MIILIVDDQPDVVRGLERSIDWTSLGIKTVLSANSVSVAKRLLLHESVDILLSDIEIPPANGLELLSLIRDQNLKTKCIFLSAYAEFTYAQEAVRLGAFDYILQPAPYEKIKEAVMRLIETYNLSGTKNNKEQTNRQIPDLVEELDKEDPIEILKNHIRANLDQELGRQELAEMVHLNPDYLSRLFKRETGLSLIQFILQERILLAKHMLLETSVPISLIALKTGFTNFSYFSQVFKRETDLSPQEFRKEQSE